MEKQVISWQEVEDEWKKSEDNEIWHDFFVEKGFQTWEDWRWARVQMLNLPNREWAIRNLENPIEAVKKMYCDLTTRWKEFCPTLEGSKFEHLVNHEFFVNHKRVNEIRRNFPENTQLIGLQNHDQVIIFDGHHRATALAGMDNSKTPLVKLAFTEISDQEFAKYHSLDKQLEAERKVYDLRGKIRARVMEVFRK